MGTRWTLAMLTAIKYPKLAMLKPSNLGDGTLRRFRCQHAYFIRCSVHEFVVCRISNAGKGRQMQFFRRYLSQVVRRKFLRREK